MPCGLPVTNRLKLPEVLLLDAIAVAACEVITADNFVLAPAQDCILPVCHLSISMSFVQHWAVTTEQKWDALLVTEFLAFFIFPLQWRMQSSVAFEDGMDLQALRRQVWTLNELMFHSLSCRTLKICCTDENWKHDRATIAFQKALTEVSCIHFQFPQSLFSEQQAVPSHSPRAS